MSDMINVEMEEQVSSIEEKSENIGDTTVVEDIVDFDLGDISYDTLKVSKILGVQESTVRKYCALMVKNGYRFSKNKVGHRVFYDRDIEIIREIVDLKNEGVMLEEAVKTVLSAHREDISNTTDITDLSTINANYSRLLEEFETFRNVQIEFNQQLIQKLESQSDYIKKMIEERDKRLVQSIRQTMELKQSKKKKSLFNFLKK